MNREELSNLNEEELTREFRTVTKDLARSIVGFSTIILLNFLTAYLAFSAYTCYTRGEIFWAIVWGVFAYKGLRSKPNVNNLEKTIVQ